MTLDVIVKPGSKQPGISIDGEIITIRVRERPIENAANEACIRALAKHLGVPPSKVTLVSGAKSRRKRFSVSP